MATELVRDRGQGMLEIVDTLVEISDLLDTADEADIPAIKEELERVICNELASKTDGVAWYDRRADSEIDLLDDITREVSRKKAQWLKRKVMVREIAKCAMSRLGVSLIKGKVHSVSLRQGVESLVIEDESQLPDDYKQMRTVVTADIDKAAIKRDLKAGKVIPGARLVRGDEVLTIR